jgi:hypothetical protein
VRWRGIAASTAIILCLGAALPARAAEPPRGGRVGDPANDKIILVRGWTQDELEQIAHAFVRLYDVPPGYRIQKHIALRALAVMFPGDIDADLFCYFVNYINYPKNFDLKGRKIAVLGKTKLTRAFGHIDPKLLGSHARIYVPAGDTEYDVVYVRVGDGVIYKFTFADSTWEAVSDSGGRRI